MSFGLWWQGACPLVGARRAARSRRKATRSITWRGAGLSFKEAVTGSVTSRGSVEERRLIVNRIWHAILARVNRRERTELRLLLVAVAALSMALAFVYVADNVMQGDTRHFDE